MPVQLDAMDRKILSELQRDASQSLDDIAGKVGSSKTPVWNRIRKMREGGDDRATDGDPGCRRRRGLEACFFRFGETATPMSAMQIGRGGSLQALQAPPRSARRHTVWRGRSITS